MKVVLSGKVVKVLKSINMPDSGRIVKALNKLSQNPPEGDIKSLTGKDGYRLRIGQYRILFDIIDNKIVVYDIGSRGQIYKGV